MILKRRIEMCTAELDSQTVLRQSYSVSEENWKKSKTTVSSSGELSEENEVAKSTHSSKYGFYEFINQKANDYIEEQYNSYVDSGIDDIDIILPGLNPLIFTMKSSIENLVNSLSYLGVSFLSDFPADFEFDEDGELILEWYGRIGARVNLTFGKNAELYFVFLFHGESTKSKLFINRDSANLIKNALVKLFNDKV